MTIKELIGILEKYDPDFKVAVETIVNGVDIDHVNPEIGFSYHLPGVIIYPEDQTPETANLKLLAA